jgi:7,8-dihydropterin-6-yl-methyl-4-(beta-D-ribofuranosyl)aminobenzene 5'-phosphate synthase
LRITALVENFSEGKLKPKHGLSLYIETKKHKLLFDLGPDTTIFENAGKRNIDLSEVDTVIISHGHMDHGGALKRFLQVNTKAKIYVQRRAFEQHYTKQLFLKVNIGLDRCFRNHPQVILVDGDTEIDEELSLFIVDNNSKCYSNANDSLYEGYQKDYFKHEQNLVIQEKQTAVIIGCGHMGIVNIMEKAISFEPQICVGGYHLFNPLTKKTVNKCLLDEIVENLKQYPQIQFYTCHCTGKKAYDYLSSKMPNMHYLSCGNTI